MTPFFEILDFLDVQQIKLEMLIFKAKQGLDDLSIVHPFLSILSYII